MSANPIDEPEERSFADLGLRPELLSALSTLGYEEPTPIQREAIPPLIDGRDLLGQAATGTGKTAAFALPLLQRLPVGPRQGSPFALVLVPTRELAIQVSEAVHRYGRELGARVLPIYGGQPIGRQLAALDRGVDVVVATPGRAIDHLSRGTLRLEDLGVVVLDEADEMFDMGFAEDIESILAQTPSTRQTVLFSATLPTRIDRMARRHLRDPVRIQIAPDTAPSGEAPLVRQDAYMVLRGQKAAALGRILDVESPGAALVFCRTRIEVDQLTETLNARGYRAEALHGGMNQEQRDRVMSRLRSGTADLLVATDVAARGLDVEQLTHVVNYDVPSAPDSYVHRIGRVGRAGREGVAITLAEPREHRMLKNIERITNQRINVQKVPTVADLQARRLELTQTALREAIEGGGLEQFRPVVETLAEEFDLVDVALAAVKLVHLADAAPGDEVEIAAIAQPRREEWSPRDDRSGGKDRARQDSRPARPSDRYGHDDRPSRDDRPRSSDRPSSDDRGGRPVSPGRGDRRGGAVSNGMTRLYVGAGKEAGIRPQDLVGAIAGESNLSGRDIGAIEITERFSLVEVPENAVEDVIAALRGTTVKGQRITIRRERY